jgi:replicative DNA helicase
MADRCVLLAGNVGRAAGHPYHFRAGGNLVERIRRGKITEDEFDRLVECKPAAGSHAALHRRHRRYLTIAQVAARAAAEAPARSLGLIVVDYLQLLAGSARRASSESRVQEVTEITTGLKALAKELNVPIIALSQLSRQVENRDDKRPQLADLRESGSIEQDADVVMFIYREGILPALRFMAAKPAQALRNRCARLSGRKHGY